MERALGEYEIDSVIHLAAQTIGGIANRNPVSTRDQMRGTWTLLEACRRCPTVRQVVVASSDKAYGDLNWSRIVPGTIRSILRGQPPIIRSDGSFVRGYFYVEDGAAAYIMLAEKLAGNPEFAWAAFNFSNEIQLPVIDLVRLISRLMNSNVNPFVLGWRRLFTLDEALLRTIAWYREFLS